MNRCDKCGCFTMIDYCATCNKELPPFVIRSKEDEEEKNDNLDAVKELFGDMFGGKL